MHRHPDTRAKTMGALRTPRDRSPLRLYRTALLSPAVAGFANRSKTNFEFRTGGGVRYYVKNNWGIRPEVRVFISSRTLTRISVGVFYHIDAGWPFRARRNSTSSRNGRLLR